MDPQAVKALVEGRHEVVGADASGRVAHGGAEDPRLLDFSTNVNPETPEGTARVFEASYAESQRYPADDYTEFRAAAAEHVGCEPRQVVPTAGAMDAIRLAVATTVAPGDAVLVHRPCFGEYDREVLMQGGEPTHVDVASLLRADPADYGLVICCTPNNPTGALPARQTLAGFAEKCRAAGTPLLIDESFLGFTEQRSLAGRDGVIAVRSITKLFGIPGLRAGFLVATRSLLDRFEVARPPWSVGATAAAVGAHSMEQTAFVADTRQRVDGERERMAERLATRFEVAESDAPFLLCELDSSDAVEAVLTDLRAEGIVVRDARTFRGLDAHVRVAVRRSEENDQLLAALGV